MEVWDSERVAGWVAAFLRTTECSEAECRDAKQILLEERVDGKALADSSTEELRALLHLAYGPAKRLETEIQRTVALKPASDDDSDRDWEMVDAAGNPPRGCTAAKALFKFAFGACGAYAAYAVWSRPAQLELEEQLQECATVSPVMLRNGSYVAEKALSIIIPFKRCGMHSSAVDADASLVSSWLGCSQIAVCKT